MVSRRHSIRVSHCGERGVRGRPGASTQGRAQPTTAPLHWQGTPGFLRQHGQREGPPRLQPGDGMENRLPAQDGADAGCGRQVQHRTPGAAETTSEPQPHMTPPRPQPQVHPRGSAGSSLSYVANLLSPHPLTLIQCTAGQELQGAVGEQPPCSGDKRGSTGWIAGASQPGDSGGGGEASQGHMALLSGRSPTVGLQTPPGAAPGPRHTALSATAPVWKRGSVARGSPSPTPAAPQH